MQFVPGIHMVIKYILLRELTFKGTLPFFSILCKVEFFNSERFGTEEYKGHFVFFFQFVEISWAIFFFVGFAEIIILANQKKK